MHTSTPSASAYSQAPGLKRTPPKWTSTSRSPRSRFDDFSGYGYAVDFLHAGGQTFLRDFIVGVADGRAGLREIMRGEAVAKQRLGGEVAGLPSARL